MQEPDIPTATSDELPKTVRNYLLGFIDRQKEHYAFDMNAVRVGSTALCLIAVHVTYASWDLYVKSAVNLEEVLLCLQDIAPGGHCTFKNGYWYLVFGLTPRQLNDYRQRQVQN